MRAVLDSTWRWQLIKCRRDEPMFKMGAGYASDLHNFNTSVCRVSFTRYYTQEKNCSPGNIDLITK